jgi:four helix bundle protein
MRGFKDLEVWQEAQKLTLEIYKVTSRFPQGEKFDLTSQMRSSANSIAANIAESHGRYFYADKVRVLYQARGEIEEIRSHISLALGLKYISADEYKEFEARYEYLGMRVSRYIAVLKDNKSTN